MITNIVVFFAILSLVYTLRFVVEFIIKFLSEEPKLMKLSKVDIVFLYLTISYLITFIIRWSNV
jgi:hypothetical protein